MALALIYSLGNIWPLSIFKHDDLKISNELVSKLPIPESMKRFVFAVRDPESRSVIYILAAQNLSERSAIDAECLIRTIKPDAVIAQVGHVSVSEMQSEEGELDGGNDPVPTSSFEVVKRCFMNKINKEKYENVASNLVLREIFGIGFHGHILAAKGAAEEVGSTFLLLETPFVKKTNESCVSDEAAVGAQSLVRNLVPQEVSSIISSSSRRFLVTEDAQLRMLKLLSSYVDMPLQKSSHPGVEEIQPESSYVAPTFAQSIYPLLVDLHDIFINLPSIGRALAFSQKMLHDVNQGEVVDSRTFSEVYTFRVAVEGLRIALNDAGRLPIKQPVEQNKTVAGFQELPEEDKSYSLLAQALQSQTHKFKKIVAVVDAKSLGGLRRHWNTPLPAEVKDLIGKVVCSCENGGEASMKEKKKWFFSDKPVVAVGAGATAVLGASSLSKAVPASTFLKALTFKLPTSIKLMLTQTNKIMTVVFGKAVGPSKLVAPGLTSSSVNATSILKAAASAEKIRTIAHSVIASVEKTSFSAMRTAFYEIMRNRQRHVKPVGVLPWATFGCSIATCSGLLLFGDGIEYAVESVPAAPSIASLGRGVQHLHQVAEEVGQKDGVRIQKSIESLMHRLRKVKAQ